MQNIKEYQVFIAIVEQGSLAAAAHRLHLSVSAVSKYLARLEERLGVELVQRTTRAMAVTKAGEAFFPKARAILQAVEEAEAGVLDDARQPSGVLRVTLPRALVDSPVMTAMARFCDLYPDIRLDLHVSDEIEDLIEQRIDVSFRVGHLVDDRLVAIPLFETPLLFCATPAYWQQHGFIRDVNQLQQHRVVVPSYLNLSSRLHGLFPGLREEHRQQFHWANDAIAMREMVKAGMGFGVLLQVLAQPALDEGALVAQPDTAFLPVMPVNLLFLQQAVLPATLQCFKDWMKSCFTHTHA